MSEMQKENLFFFSFPNRSTLISSFLAADYYLGVFSQYREIFVFYCNKCNRLAIG